jgi:hypothetical protein
MKTSVCAEIITGSCGIKDVPSKNVRIAAIVAVSIAQIRRNSLYLFQRQKQTAASTAR